MYRKSETFFVTSEWFMYSFWHFVWIPVVTLIMGRYAVAQLVEALRYKSEGCKFDSRWCHWNFSLTYSFQSHYGPGVDSASNWNEYQEYFLGGKGGPVHRADNFTTFMCWLSWNLGASTSCNPLDLSNPVMGLIFTLMMIVTVTATCTMW